MENQRTVRTGIHEGDWLRLFEPVHYAKGQQRVYLTEQTKPRANTMQCFLERQNYAEKRESRIDAGRFRINKVAYYSEPFGGKKLLQLPSWLRPAHVDFTVTLLLDSNKYGQTAQMMSCYKRYFAANGAHYPNLWDIQSALRSVAAIEKPQSEKVTTANLD